MLLGQCGRVRAPRRGVSAVFAGLFMSDNMTVLFADVFEKFLKQEKARLLEQAQLHEDNKAAKLVSVGMYVCNVSI